IMNLCTDWIQSLWLQKPIGSTDNALGIHQIAAVLEFLKRWSLETYWPWFKGHFL
ncbi:hypothetical protein IWW34DRAFT_553400, partial [Fusarium oxysporum f. sp. albedinis]